MRSPRKKRKEQEKAQLAVVRDLQQAEARRQQLAESRRASLEASSVCWKQTMPGCLLRHACVAGWPRLTCQQQRLRWQRCSRRLTGIRSTPQRQSLPWTASAFCLPRCVN